MVENSCKFHVYPFLVQIFLLKVYTWSFFSSIFLCRTHVCLGCYGLLAATIFEPKTIRVFWTRLNQPLLATGGLWVPASLLIKWWAPFKYLLLLNPLYYFSEGLRGSILQKSSEYMSFSASILGLSCFGVIFFAISIAQFKRRVDPI